MQRSPQQAFARLQQLTSLLEWQVARCGEAARQLQLRRRYAADAAPAADSTSGSVAYSKARKHFNVSLAELRKQWAAERQERLARQEVVDEAARVAKEAKKAQRARQDAEAKVSRQQAYQSQQAEERELRALARAARLQRQALREEVLGVAREERRQWLLAQSRAWVTAEALDARVEEALANPVPLFPAPASPAGGAQRGPR